MADGPLPAAQLLRPTVLFAFVWLALAALLDQVAADSSLRADVTRIPGRPAGRQIADLVGSAS
jgi:hypothetical protein